MSIRTMKLGIGIAALVFASLACNFITGGSQSDPSSDPTPTASSPSESGEIETEPGPETRPETEPQAEPTPLPPPTDPPTDTDISEGPATLDLTNPALFAEPPVEILRTNMAFTFEGVDASGQSITGTTTVEGMQRANPKESSMTFSTFGNAVVGNDERYIFTQIGETSYLTAPSTGCITGPASDIDNPFDLFLDTGGFLIGEANRIMPDEFINNVDTFVYEITQENLNPADPASLDVSAVEGRLHIAKDKFYVARLVLTGLGSSEVLSGDPNLEGDLYYEINFIEFFQLAPITPPEGCTSADPTAIEYPILEDAYELFSLGSELISYETKVSFDEALDFYQTEMAALGWLYDANESFIISPSAFLAFSNAEGANVTILIGEGSTGEESLSILITESQ